MKVIYVVMLGIFIPLLGEAFMQYTAKLYEAGEYNKVIALCTGQWH